MVPASRTGTNTFDLTGRGLPQRAHSSDAAVGYILEPVRRSHCITISCRVLRSHQRGYIIAIYTTPSQDQLTMSRPNNRFGSDSSTPPKQRRVSDFTIWRGGEAGGLPASGRCVPVGHSSDPDTDLPDAGSARPAANRLGGTVPAERHDVARTLAAGVAEPNSNQGFTNSRGRGEDWQGRVWQRQQCAVKSPLH